MKTKIISVLLLIGALLMVAFLAAGCGSPEHWDLVREQLDEYEEELERLKKEIDLKLEEMEKSLEEMENPEPYPTSAEETISKPTPEPSPEVIDLSDESNIDNSWCDMTEEEEGALIGEMPVPPEWIADVNDYLYGVHVNNDYNAGTSMTVHQHEYDGTKDEARKVFGEAYTGKEMDTYTFDGPISVPENSVVEVEIRMDIGEDDEGTKVIIFHDKTEIIKIPEVLTDDTIDEMVDELGKSLEKKAECENSLELELKEWIDLNTDKKAYDGIGYYPQTGGFERFGVWQSEVETIESLVRFEKGLADSLCEIENDGAADGPLLCIQIEENNFIIIDTVLTYDESRPAWLRIRQTNNSAK